MRILSTRLLACSLLLSAGVCAAQKKHPRVSQLTSGKPIDRQIKGGETQSFLVTLKQGQFLRAVVDSQDIDVIATLYAPAGQKLLTVDLLKYPSPEPVSLEVEKAGAYRLEIRADAAAILRGRYKLTSVVKPQVQNTDRERLTAERLLIEANDLERAGAKKSLQKSIDKLGEALLLWLKLGDPYWEAYSLNHSGRAAAALKKNQEALAFYNQALFIRKEIGDRFGEAHTLITLGNLYVDLGENQKALELYNRALPLKRAIGDKNGEAVTLNKLGLANFDLGETQKAFEFYNQALPIFRAVGDKGGEAHARNNLGLVYSDLGEMQKALELFNQALALYQVVDDKGSGATTLVNLGRVYSDLGEKQKALEFYNQALPLKRALGDKIGEAYALINFGIVYSDLGEKQKALGFYSQALSLYRAVGYKTGEADALNNFGRVYSDLGEKQKALEFYNQALPLKRVISDKSGEADILNNIGNVYSDLGETQKALEFYNLALPLKRAVGDKAGESTALNNIGTCYSNLGEKRRALVFFDQALPIERAVGDKLNEGNTLNNIANVYADLGERQKAIDFYNQALLLKRAVGDRSSAADTLTNLGLIYAGLNERQKALDLFNEALLLEQAVRDKGGEAHALLGIGGIYYALGEKQKALQFYQQALPLKRVVGEKSGEAFTLRILMHLWKDLGKPALAIFYGKQAINDYQQLRGNIKGLEKEIQKTFLGKVESGYRYLAGLLIAQGRIPEAERVLEMLKEEEFFQYTRRDKAVASALLTRTDLSDKEQKALDEYSKIADQLTSIGSELEALEAERLKLPEDAAFPKQTQLDDLKPKLAAATKSFQVFQRQLEEQFGKTDVRVAQIESGLQSDLKSWSVSNTVIISTIVGTDQLQLIVTTPTVQEPHTIEISAAKLNALVAEFREAVIDPRIDPRPAGEKLYEVLVKPIEGDLAGAKAKTLIWSLDGTLRYVPIAALWDGKHYLVERFQNVVIALASRSKVAAGPMPVSQWRGLGLGVSKSWGSFPALEAVPDELKGIIRQEGTSGAANEQGVLPGRRLLDSDFTRSNLERALGRYSVIHIASHFDFLPGTEKSSFLLLGDGTRLTLDAISSSTPLFDKVELLTLSACNTATGGDAEGAEVEGFGVLAQKQGALAVLATLWAVADASTGRLMREFYRQRVANPELNKAEALRQAQLSLFRGNNKVDEASTIMQPRSSEKLSGASSAVLSFKPDPNAKYAHPYYWAPFILIGNWK